MHCAATHDRDEPPSSLTQYTLVPPPNPQHPDTLGPRAFSSIIGYRLIANTAIVCVTAPSFNDPDMAMTESRAMFLYFVVFSVCVVSLVGVICSMAPRYRHTFFGSKTGKEYYREMWQTTVLHDSIETLDEQREGNLCATNVTYPPVDLARAWILAKADEVDRGRDEQGEAYVAPRWLTHTSCKRMLVVIRYWRAAGMIDEAEADGAREAVARLEAGRSSNPEPTHPQFVARPSASAAPPLPSTEEKVSHGAQVTATPPPDPSETPPVTQVPTQHLNVPTPAAAVRGAIPAGAPRRLPRLSGAKVVPSTALLSANEGEAEAADLEHAEPPSTDAPATTAAVHDPASPQHRAWSTSIAGGFGTRPAKEERKLSRAESLGVRASIINRRRQSSLAGNALVLSFSKELAEVMRESSRTEEAVLEWWDVNIGVLSDEQKEGLVRELLAALAEELWPALWLAKAFVRLALAR